MIPEQDMAIVAGMRSANRRLARLGVESVDFTACDHGVGVSCRVQVKRVMRDVYIHGATDPITALDQLVDEISALKRR